MKHVVMLVLAGMAFLLGSAHAAYTVLIGVYTTDQASSDACRAHRQHPTDYCFSQSNTLDGTVNVCASQDIKWHNGQPGYPNIYPDRYYSISTEDCGGECPVGQQPTGPGGMCVTQATCPTDDVQKFHSDVLGAMPDSVCSNGCWYNNISDGMHMVDMANGGWLAEFQSTGNQCEVETGGDDGGGAPENCIVDSTTGEYFCPGGTQAGAPPNCIEDGKGNQICIDQYDPLNCGYINNESWCWPLMPDGECTFFGDSGDYICVDKTPPSSPPLSPPAPNDGTPGSPVAPDVTITQGDNNMYFYDSTTLGNSSGVGGAPGVGNMGSPGDGCLPGEPGCPAHLDTEGIPASTGGDDDQRFAEKPTGLEGVTDAIDDLGSGAASVMAAPPSSLTGLGDLFPSSGSCSPLQIDLFGQTATFDICTELAWMRELMAWVFYIITAIMLFQIAMDTRGL